MKLKEQDVLYGKILGAFDRKGYVFYLAHPRDNMQSAINSRTPRNTLLIGQTYFFVPKVEGFDSLSQIDKNVAYNGAYIPSSWFDLGSERVFLRNKFELKSSFAVFSAIDGGARNIPFSVPLAVIVRTIDSQLKPDFSRRQLDGFGIRSSFDYSDIDRFVRME